MYNGVFTQAVRAAPARMELFKAFFTTPVGKLRRTSLHARLILAAFLRV